MTDGKNELATLAKDELEERLTNMLKAFPKPILLVSEDKHQYLLLRNGILSEIRPRGMVDLTLAMKYVNCCWEIMRYERAAAGIITITHRAALLEILNDVASAGIEKLTPEQLAEGWFKDSKIRALAEDHLQRFAIDDETVSAQALAMRYIELGKVREMHSRAQLEALALLREIDRRREVATSPDDPAQLVRPSAESPSQPTLNQ